MIFNVTSGGGGGLNLKVVGGTTQPTTPRENTIWIKTNTAITGYVLSPTQPETGTEGLVWLKTSDTGIGINIGRKNAVLLHLANGMLYTGSAWEVADVWAYTTVWKQFSFSRLYLYQKGDEYTAYTGGWTVERGEKKNKSIVVGNPTKGGSFDNKAYTSNMIDLTNFKKLIVHIAKCASEPDASGSNLKVFGADDEVVAVANIFKGVTAETEKTVTLDVSNINQECTIAVQVNMRTSSSRYSYTEFDEVYAE